MIVGLVLFLAVALLGTWAGALVFNIGDVDMPALALVQLNALFLVLAVGDYCFLVSALSSDGGKAIGVAAELTVVLFFLDFLASLWSAVDWLGRLSASYYYDPVSVANHKALPGPRGPGRRIGGRLCRRPNSFSAPRHRRLAGRQDQSQVILDLALSGGRFQRGCNPL